MKTRQGKTFEQKMYEIRNSKYVSLTFENLSKPGTRIFVKSSKYNIRENWTYPRVESTNQRIPARTWQKLIKNCKYKILSNGWIADELMSTITTIVII